MNFEFNKIAGAVLGTALGVMAINIVSAVIYEPHHSEQPGYVIAVADAGEEGGGHGGGPEEVEPIADRLQVASVDEGMNQAKKCLACHTFDNGGPAKVGPNLWNVVGGPYAHSPDFAYSEAFQTAAAEGGVWTFEELDDYLENPRSDLPGTAMAFAGIRRPDQRADVILYLRSLSDEPVPLPAVTAAVADEEMPAEDTPEGEAADTQAMEAGDAKEEMAGDAAAAEDMADETDAEEETTDEAAVEEPMAEDDAATPANATETPESGTEAADAPADEAAPADGE